MPEKISLGNKDGKIVVDFNPADQESPIVVFTLEEARGFAMVLMREIENVAGPGVGLGREPSGSQLTENDQRLLQEIETLGRDDTLGMAVVEKINQYWHDYDRAERTPRHRLYFHQGILFAMVQRLAVMVAVHQNANAN